MSMEIQLLIDYLKDFAPLELAEEWDNVGLLIGDPGRNVDRVLTCLTLTPDVVREAIETEVQLIVSHHPLMFRPLKKITTETSEGEMLLELIAHRISVYSPHTAFDSASLGINQKLAEKFDLTEISPIRLMNHCGLPAGSGSGRYGRLRNVVTLDEFLKLVRTTLNVKNLQYAGDPKQPIAKVGIACGSAAEFLGDARLLGCDVLLTGEGRFHACLEALALGIALVLAGHYTTERPAVEELAIRIATVFPDLKVWPSNVEADPLRWSLA